MIYPEFLRPGGTIGITAPSAGVGDKLADFDVSLRVLRERGYQIKETASVRNTGIVSADGVTRARELAELITDNGVDYLLMAAGGDFMMEMLPFVDFDTIAKHPKWIQGYSDVTNILFPVTTLLDIATIYGQNAGGYNDIPLHEYQYTSLDFLRGDVKPQSSFPFHRAGFDDSYARPVVYNAPNGDFSASGRLLGGCIEALSDTLAGTRFDGTKGFIERHRGDGVIWYFDVFSKSSEQVALALWQFKELGWFDNASAFIFGRVLFESNSTGLSYEDAIVRVLGGDAKIVTNFDVGHLAPKMTMINGAKAVLTVRNGKGSIEMTLG